MAQAGRHAVKHRFSWRAISDGMLNLYTEVLGDRSKGPGEGGNPKFRDNPA
jgi:hypothetical protein